MSKITREMLDAAIQADRAEFGQDLYSKKREIYTDNEYHCEQRFGDEYYGNLSNLHEVTMFSVDLTGDWLLDSKGMASDIRNGFKNIVNNCGEYSNLDVKLDYDEKDGITTITANVYNQDGVYVGCGYLYNGYETDMYKVDELFIKSLKQGIDELNLESEHSKDKSVEKQREQIIEAGADVRVWGDSSESYDIHINESNAKGNYEDLEESEIHEDLYLATYLHGTDFECVQDFADLFRGGKEVVFDETTYTPSAGNIDSYGTIRCDADVRMENGSLKMDIKGYDYKTKAELFTATADANLCFGSKLRVDYDFYSQEHSDMVLTAEDMWPTNVGLMELKGRNVQQVIDGLPVLCDKRHVEIDGDTLRIPMSEATADIMKEKGMIYGFEPKDKETVAQLSTSTEVKLNDSLLTEKEGQMQSGLSK